MAQARYITGVSEVPIPTLSTFSTTFSQVLLFGGGTRIPKVRDLILSAAKGHEQLGMSLNTDEAAALGAVYQAAHLSKGFRVQKFLVKDANVYPIEVGERNDIICL